MTGPAQLATFLVGGHEYALDIMRIKEIIVPLGITPVPRAPAFLEGVIELRGAIIPVVDLRKRFDVPAPAPSRATKYIIVAIDRSIVGLVVDAVGEVVRPAAGELRPPPPLVSSDGPSPFAAVCRHGGRLIMVLDLDRVLTSREKLTLSGMSA
ncbi:MAG TPA: chemotaxis protein CheW [Haliangiales bacterium]|nr:chemotaxis protein CheW [Haliangiales bacterium]